MKKITITYAIVIAALTILWVAKDHRPVAVRQQVAAMLQRRCRMRGHHFRRRLSQR
jgi:hypothetical protein